MVAPSLVVPYPDFPSSPQVLTPASGSRYARPGKARPELTQAPPAQEPQANEAGLDAWLGVTKQAEVDGSAASVVVNELPSLQLRAQSAVADNDPDALSAVTSRISEIKEQYGDALAPWANLRNAGPEGRRVSALVYQVMSGQFKHDPGWGAGNKTVAQVENSWSEEGMASKARRTSLDLSIDEGTARAMFDRNDPRYSVYGRFSGLLDKNTKAMTPDATQAKDRQTAFLRSVQRFDRKYSDRFDNAHDLGEFVTAFDDNVNKDGLFAGDSAMAAAADAFLAQRDKSGRERSVSADDFMHQYAASVQALMPPRPKPQDGKAPTREQTILERMTVHEAQSLLAAFTKRAGDLGVQDQVVTGLYRDTLANAATMNRRLHEFYGIDLGEKSGASAAVADLALSRLNVPGADAGLAPRVDELTSRLQMLMSDPTRKMVQRKQGERGDVSSRIVDGHNPYLHIEMSLVRKTGAALWKVVSDYKGDVETAMSRIMSGGRERGEILAAMESALAPRFGKKLAAGIASDMWGNLVGQENGPKTTLEESLRRRSGCLEAGSPDAIPANKTLSAGDGLDDGDVALLARGELIKSVKGDEGLRDAQRRLAVAWQDREGKDKNFKYFKSVGNLYAQATGDWDELVASGLLGKLSKATSFDDPKRYAQIRTAANRLCAMATDTNISESQRAEALVKLLIVGASGARLWEEGEAARHNGVYDPNPLWPSVQRAARSLGLVLPDQKSLIAQGFASSVARLAKVVPALADSTLVKSGYLNLATGKLDEKNMLRVQQAKSYGDPKANDGRDENLSDEQRAARRALATFETEDTAVGRAMARHREHLEAQGFSGTALDTQEAAANAALVDAYRNEGVVGVERQLGKLMARRVRFLPVPVQTSNGYMFNQDKVQATDLLSDEQWEEQQRIYAGAYERQTGQKLPDGVIEMAQVTGPGVWRDQVAFAKRRAELDAREAARAQFRE